MNLLNAYGELGNRASETVVSPMTTGQHFHQASHAPPAAPAPGFSQTTLVDGELPPQKHKRPLSIKTSAKSNDLFTAPSTVMHTGKCLSPAANHRTQSYRKNVHQPLYFDSAFSTNLNYMNVIKESQQSILRRRLMEQEKRRILDMDFEALKHNHDWRQLNQFLTEKRSEMISTASNVDTRDSNAKVASNLLDENREAQHISSVPLVQSEQAEAINDEMPTAS